MHVRPLVSIILPTFNRVDLLPRAIQCVLAQTYPSWELLIWDDGSSDDTHEVVQSFQDDRIRYYYDENHGKPYALNQAIQRSQGEYIAFLDDDDQWTKSKFSQQLPLMELNAGVDLVFGNYRNRNIVDHTEGIGFAQSSKGLSYLTTKKIKKRCHLIIDGFLKGIAKSNFIAFDSVIVRREILKLLGPFNEDLHTSEDFEYWWRFGLCDCNAGYTEDIVLNRFKYPGSLSGRSLKSINKHLMTLDTCTELSIKHLRPDTINYLKPMYRNAWQNMVVALGNTGDKKGVWYAFSRSLDYGFRLGSVKLLIHALSKEPIPPKII